MILKRTDDLFFCADCDCRLECMIKNHVSNIISNNKEIENNVFEGLRDRCKGYA